MPSSSSLSRGEIEKGADRGAAKAPTATVRRTMNAFRAATRLAPRAAARATGSFQQQTASSEFAKSGWRRYAGRGGTCHDRRSAIQSLVPVCTLPTDYGGVLRLGGWVGGGGRGGGVLAVLLVGWWLRLLCGGSRRLVIESCVS